MLGPLALAALCGCGAGGPTAPTATPEAAPPGPATQTPAAAEAVLTVDDLPEGWSVVPAESDSDSGAGDSCLDRLGAAGGPFDSSVAQTVTFTAGGIGPFLAASVVERPAEQVLPAVDDVLVTCDGQTSEDGLTTTVEPAAIDGLPPDALAVRGADLGEDGSGVRYVVAAAGTGAATVMVLVVTPLGDVDEALVADAVNTAYARLPTS